ncbi:MAG: hypothetical protein ACLRFE_02730 [Clostridia bacterium]
MAIWTDEVGVNGDDSVLITDLRKCRAIEDIDKDINKITKPRLICRMISKLLKKDAEQIQSSANKIIDKMGIKY